MAISGIDRGAPKWIFLEHLKANPEIHLEKIAEKLRTILKEAIEERPMDKQASELVDRFLNQVLETERSLLPRKKQRALHEMELILSHYLKHAQEQGDLSRIETVKEAKELLAVPANSQDRPDLEAVAEAWLDLIREAWYERLANRRRFKPLRLKDIRKDLKDKPLESEKIVHAFSQIPSAQPIHTRVVSAIVGVPDNLL